MDVETSKTNVEKNEPGAKLPQYIAAFIVTLGGFATGTMISWTSPTEVYIKAGKYGFPVTELQFALIGSLVNVGGMIGALCSGAVADMFGRRKTLIALVILASIGYAVILWSQSALMMMFGRIILGLPMGAYSMICPLYTNEIAEVSIRGTVGSLYQLQVTIGVLYCYIFGIFCKPFILTLINATIPILLAFLMFFMPETPFYLIKKDKEQEARKSLQWLRGEKYNIDSEIAMLNQANQQMQSEQLSFSKAFSTRAAKRSLAVGLPIMMLQQFNGIGAVVFFASSIFRAAGSHIDDAVSSMIVGAMSVIATAVATVIIDRSGRKPLLFFSAFVMCISSAILGAFFLTKKLDPVLAEKVSFLPLITVCVFIIVFSVGLGPIPWMILAEIYPPSIKGPASSISCLVNWISTFTVTFCFQPVQNIIGAYSVFWIFAAVSGLGAAFVALVVPETKGKTLEEIQRHFEGKPNPNAKH